MGAESRTSGRGIRLDRIALVEQTLLIDLAKEVPERLDVAVIVGDIGVLHIDPVAHTASQLLPFLRVFHDFTATGSIVLIDADLLPDVFLRDAEGLFHTELDR